MRKLIYNGKYHYGLYRGGEWMELRSLTKEDEGFKPDEAWRYTKLVKPSECTDIRKVWLLVERNDERRVVLGMDYGMQDFFTDTVDGPWDDCAWNNIDEFKKYYLVFDNYFEPKEENKVYLTKEELVEYAKLFASLTEKYVL